MERKDSSRNRTLRVHTLTLKQERDIVNSKWYVFNLPKLNSSDIHPPTRPHLFNIPNLTTKQRPNIYMDKTMGAFSIKTPHRLIVLQMKSVVHNSVLKIRNLCIKKMFLCLKKEGN